MTRLSLQAPRPTFAKSFEADLAKSTTGAMHDVSDWLKDAVDAEVKAAGLGSKLGKATRRDVYPRGQDSADAALFFQAKPGTNAPTLFDVFNNGATIRSNNGFWLAIPVPAVAKGRYLQRSGRLGKVTPGAWERATGIKLRFVYRRGRASLLVADNVRITSSGGIVPMGGIGRSASGPNVRLQGRASAVIFYLVPQSQIRRRLNWSALGRQASALFPQYLTARLYR